MRTETTTMLCTMMMAAAMMLLLAGCTDPCDQRSNRLPMPFSFLATGGCEDDDSSDDPSLPPSSSTPEPTTAVEPTTSPSTDTPQSATDTPVPPTGTPEPPDSPTPGPLDCTTVCATVGGTDTGHCGDGIGRSIYWVPCAEPEQFVSVKNSAYTLGQSVCYGDNDFAAVKASWSDSGMWTIENPQVIYVWQSSELADECQLSSETWGQAPLMGTDIIAIDWTPVTTQEGEQTAYPVWNLCSLQSEDVPSVDVTALGEDLISEWLNPPTPTPAP